MMRTVRKNFTRSGSMPAGANDWVVNCAGARRSPGLGYRGFHQVTSGGAPAARAHGGDPHGGRAAEVVGGSIVRAASFPLPRGGDIPQGGSAAVAAIMTVLLLVLGAKLIGDAIAGFSA